MRARIAYINYTKMLRIFNILLFCVVYGQSRNSTNAKDVYVGSMTRLAPQRIFSSLWHRLDQSLCCGQELSKKGDWCSFGVRLGLIANCSHTVQYLDCSDLN